MTADGACSIGKGKVEHRLQRNVKDKNISCIDQRLIECNLLVQLTEMEESSVLGSVDTRLRYYVDSFSAHQIP